MPLSYRTDAITFDQFAAEYGYDSLNDNIDADKALKKELTNHFINFNLESHAEEAKRQGFKYPSQKNKTRAYIEQYDTKLRNRKLAARPDNFREAAPANKVVTDPDVINYDEDRDGTAKTYFKALGLGFGTGFTEAVSGLGIISNTIARQFDEDSDWGTDLTEIGQSATEGLRNLIDIDPDQENFGTDLAQGIGQFASILIPGAAGAKVAQLGAKAITFNTAKLTGKVGKTVQIIGSSTGALGSSSSQMASAAIDGYIEQLPKGTQYNQETINELVTGAVVLGMVDAVVPGRLLSNKQVVKRTFDKIVKTKYLRTPLTTLGKATEAGLLEAGTEAFQNIASDVIDELSIRDEDFLTALDTAWDNSSFNPAQRGTTGQEAAIGGITGFAFGLLSAVALRKRGVGRDKDGIVIEQDNTIETDDDGLVPQPKPKDTEQASTEQEVPTINGEQINVIFKKGTIQSKAKKFNDADNIQVYRNASTAKTSAKRVGGQVIVFDTIAEGTKGSNGNEAVIIKDISVAEAKAIQQAVDAKMLPANPADFLKIFETANSPDPVQATTPDATQATTPDATPVTTPDAVQTATPDPTQTTTPDPVQAGDVKLYTTEAIAINDALATNGQVIKLDNGFIIINGITKAEASRVQINIGLGRVPSDPKQFMDKYDSLFSKGEVVLNEASNVPPDTAVPDPFGTQTESVIPPVIANIQQADTAPTVPPVETDHLVDVLNAYDGKFSRSENLEQRRKDNKAYYDRATGMMHGLAKEEPVSMPPTLATHRLAPYITSYEKDVFTQYGKTKTKHSVHLNIPELGEAQVIFMNKLSTLKEHLDSGKMSIRNDEGVWVYRLDSPNEELERYYKDNPEPPQIERVNKPVAKELSPAQIKTQEIKDKYGATTKTALEKIIESEDADVSSLAKWFLDSTPKEILNRKTKYNANVKRGSSGSIYQPMNIGSTDGSDATFIHEITHNIVEEELFNIHDKAHASNGKYLDFIKTVTTDKKYTKTQKELARIYLLVREHVPKLGNIAGQNPDLSMKKNRKEGYPYHNEVAYGMGNLHEFLAQSISSREMQTFLNNIPDPKAKDNTLLDRFFELISKVLKIPVKEKSALLSTLNIINDIQTKKHMMSVSQRAIHNDASIRKKDVIKFSASTVPPVEATAPTDPFDTPSESEQGGDAQTAPVENLAPNGKPSNLTSKQYKQVRTPEFKKWFGDWENDPENASKVVDENGEPLVVYHGTDSEFNIFDKTKQLEGRLGKGFYFTSSEEESKNYGSKTIQSFLNIKKLYNGRTRKTKGEGGTFGLEYILTQEGGRIFLVSNPNQIKPATTPAPAPVESDSVTPPIIVESPVGKRADADESIIYEDYEVTGDEDVFTYQANPIESDQSSDPLDQSNDETPISSANNDGQSDSATDDVRARQAAFNAKYGKNTNNQSKLGRQVDNLRRTASRYLASGGDLKNTKDRSILTKDLYADYQYDDLLYNLQHSEAHVRVADIEIREPIHNFKLALKEELPNLDRRVLKVLHKALKGHERSINRLPPLVKKSVLDMRDEINIKSAQIQVELSGVIETMRERQEALMENTSSKPTRLEREVITNIGNTINQLEYQLESVKANLPSVDNPVGSYVHTAYLAFAGRKYFNEVFNETSDRYNDFVNYLAEKHLKNNPDISLEQARSNAEADVQSLKTNISETSDKTRLHNDALVFNSIDALQKKGRLPPQVREFLGEVEDPTINFASTIHQQRIILASIEMANNIETQGRTQGWLTDKPYDKSVVPFRGSNNNPGLMMLNGLYAPELINTALNDYFTIAQLEGAIKVINSAASAVKLGKTVGSGGTQVVNLTGSIWQLGINGAIHNPKHIANAFKILKEQMQGKSASKYFKMVTMNGVVADGIAMGTIVQLTNDIGLIDPQGLFGTQTSQELIQGQPLWKKAFRTAVKTYQASDDLPKLIGFEIERDVLVRAYNYNRHPSNLITRDHPDIIKEAAQTVRDIYFTYSNANKAIKSLRNIPGTPPFIIFAAEVYRTSKNWARLNQRRLKSGNPVLQRNAAFRIISASVTMGISYNLFELLGNYIFDDEPEDETDKKLMKEFIQHGKYTDGDDLQVVGKLEDGRYEIVNVSRYNPYAPVTDVIGNLITGKGDWDNKLIEAVFKLHAPFLQPDVSFNVISDVIDRAIAPGNTWDKVTYFAPEIAKGLAPTVVTDAIRIGKAAFGDVINQDESKMSVGTAVGKAVGIRTNITDPLVELQNKGNLFKREFNLAIEARRSHDVGRNKPGVSSNALNNQLGIASKEWSRMLRSVYLLGQMGYDLRVGGQTYIALTSGKKGAGGPLSAELAKLLLGNQPFPGIKKPDDSIANKIRRTGFFRGKEAATNAEKLIDLKERRLQNR